MSGWQRFLNNSIYRVEGCLLVCPLSDGSEIYFYLFEEGGYTG
jgi:hypothetical protein